MLPPVQVLTDRPDLLQFKEAVLELEGGASQAVGLRFSPVTQPGIAEVLVFINDEEDKNEETFRVTCEYKIMVEWAPGGGSNTGVLLGNIPVEHKEGVVGVGGGGGMGGVKQNSLTKDPNKHNGGY